MSHSEQMNYVVKVRAANPGYFKDAVVLEIGSRNVNGSVRVFFDNCDYTGLDCEAGDGVDVVCLAHEYKPDKRYDTVISCEAFEHDPYFNRSVRNAIRLLRPGGLFVATWASPLRQEHGTTRANNPEGTFGPDPDYYKGVMPHDFREAVGKKLINLEVVLARSDLDVYAHGFKP